MLFIHPDHNLAVLQYEPKSLEAGIAVKAAEISTVAPNTRDEVNCEPPDCPRITECFAGALGCSQFKAEQQASSKISFATNSNWTNFMDETVAATPTSVH